MDFKSAFARATRGMREDAALHLVAMSSLTVAFLCLATAMLGIANLGALAERWGRSARITVFLRDGAEAQQVDALRMALEGLREVRSVRHVSAAEAREQFLRDSDVDGELAAIPADAFPASLEVELAAGVERVRLAAITERLSRFSVVEGVESYRRWFDRLDTLLAAGRGIAAAIAILVVLCVVFVVGNTIRLVIAGRREEIEVMKLCGATDAFVRGPFIIEGAVQGLMSSLCAIAIVFSAFLALREHVDATVAALAGTRAVFLDPIVVVVLIVGGGVLGAMGSALSLRRYLAV
jgi:cell division transport system permease protein